jgi:hypothetical protein
MVGNVDENRCPQTYAMGKVCVNRTSGGFDRQEARKRNCCREDVFRRDRDAAEGENAWRPQHSWGGVGQVVGPGAKGCSPEFRLGIGGNRIRASLTIAQIHLGPECGESRRAVFAAKLPRYVRRSEKNGFAIPASDENTRKGLQDRPGKRRPRAMNRSPEHRGIHTPAGTGR